MTERSIFEIDIVTCETRSILRASTERDLVAKAESLIRTVQGRKELIGYEVLGPSTAATGRIKAYLDDVLIELALCT